MASSSKAQLTIATGDDEDMSLYPNFSVRLPKKFCFQNMEQETMPSPKTIISKHHFHTEGSERSITDRSAHSRRSKYSQRSLLQSSALFLKSKVLVEESKLLTKEQEIETLLKTVESCQKKIAYLKQAIQGKQSGLMNMPKKIMNNLVKSYPF